MKLISKKFIKELSKLADCNICYQFISDPIECSECQNMWCRECINQNEGKCPNKCQKSDFIKPHRIFRQVINEIYVQCETCRNRVKQIDYEKHKGSKQCKIGQNLIQNDCDKLLNQEPLRKIIKKNSNKTLNQIQTQNIFQEEQNTDDSQSNILTQSTQKDGLFNKSLLEDYQQNEEKFCLSKIFSDDDDDANDGSTYKQLLVKQEKYTSLQQGNQLEAYANQQNSNFKVMHISLYKHGKWQPLEEEINTEVNFKVLQQMAENNDNDLKEMNIQIRNTFFDFSKFEVYEQYQQINIFDNDNEEYNYDSDSSTQQHYSTRVEKKKLIGKFNIYNNQEDFKQRVKVYFLHENDIIYYHEQDQQNILEQFLKNPNSTCIQTLRSKVDLVKMAEFTEKKVRDIKFELVF
ncbi:radial spoke head containing protein (macronuclear) [Tetrahymena thermophila SB210]|uniref:Radial spoke head containing protein n=1 Tax=Tetrahymena thermophila (strain SB210) TaxID=312017 RepID=I7MLG2_TETTS|nr:radial spoke head containing protein [Tetrahymena thermophila SB210]EAS02039.1 radial spoke head containing protein [Tetrahymena thermophila SB210]|eukprot:XP_001022284.1 radial spoke head containing protein [Tetrahymena thermophila SB210]